MREALLPMDLMDHADTPKLTIRELEQPPELARDPTPIQTGEVPLFDVVMIG
jgi:hypothetical protein